MVSMLLSAYAREYTWIILRVLNLWWIPQKPRLCRMFGFVVFQKWNIILIYYHDINQNITNHRTISWYIVIDVTILECFFHCMLTTNYLIYKELFYKLIQITATSLVGTKWWFKPAIHTEKGIRRECFNENEIIFLSNVGVKMCLVGYIGWPTPMAAI